VAILPVTVVNPPPTTSPPTIKKKQTKTKQKNQNKKKQLLFHHNAIFTAAAAAAAAAITTAFSPYPYPMLLCPCLGRVWTSTLVIGSGWQWPLLMLPPLPTGLSLLLLSYDHLIISHLNWIIML